MPGFVRCVLWPMSPFPRMKLCIFMLLSVHRQLLPRTPLISLCFARSVSPSVWFCSTRLSPARLGAAPLHWKASSLQSAHQPGASHGANTYDVFILPGRSLLTPHGLTGLTALHLYVMYDRVQPLRNTSNLLRGSGQRCAGGLVTEHREEMSLHLDRLWGEAPK